MTTQGTWNWRARRERQAFLALEDGTVYRGHSVGAAHDRLGEVVFNTGMTGYQEILTDPSYNGQLVAMTCAEIGNTGVNFDDVESRQVFANGFLMHEINEPSNWRSRQSLSSYLADANVPALAGIDTRALTLKLRSAGTLKGYLAVEGKLSEAEAIAQAQQWIGLDNQDYAQLVSVKQIMADWDAEGTASTTWGMPEQLPVPDMHIVSFDFGIKYNILRQLRHQGMRLSVVPAGTSAAAILELKPDGVFLSNGPADPAAVTYAVTAIRELIGKVPMMGICLGHQLMGLAMGAKTQRLKFGHHGCNHPVMDLQTRKVEITSQNHNFTVDADTMDSGSVEVTHVNLNDNTVEGLRHRREPIFTIQYHPEAAPGPHDSAYLFHRFRALIENA